MKRRWRAPRSRSSRPKGWARERVSACRWSTDFAEQSGGRLTLKSVKGAGTTVEIWLPVAGSEAKATAAEPETPQLPSVREQKLVVLAVDDDALVLMNTAAMLEDAGHQVIEATSGAEALSVLRRGEKVNLVITDQAMPGMTGIQLASAIKSDWPNMPIIMATGYAELPEGAGLDLPRLSKPFTQAQLTEAVSHAMRSRSIVDKVASFFRSE